MIETIYVEIENSQINIRHRPTMCFLHRRWKPSGREDVYERHRNEYIFMDVLVPML